MADVLSNADIYIYGVVASQFEQSTYLSGILRSSNSCYLEGNILLYSNQSAFIPGLVDSVKNKCFAYCKGIIKNAMHAYLEGEYSMAQVDYIWLKTSDGGATKSKKFRVIHPDYDDGTLEKAEEVKKTIGGGVDHSVGAIYVTWSMIIRVRHTEPETDFGNKDDIEYFYSLNNPNDTPSNDITFIDHHQVEHTVHTVGKLTKNLMGCMVEGTEAWYLYKLQLMRIQ